MSAGIMQPQQQFYRPKEACGVLRIGMATLYRRIKAGDIRVSKLGGATLISQAEIDRVTNPAQASAS